MRLMITAGAALAIAGAAYAYGRHDGRALAMAAQARATAALQARLFDTADKLSVASAAIEAARTVQETLAMEIEDAARADPDAAIRRPDARSLQRLATRWGAPASP